MQTVTHMANTHTRILVVDDDPDWREGMKEALQDEGYLVAAAPDGRAALDLVEHFRPFVVVTDFQMPIMNGAEFVSRVRSIDGRVPVIVVTADANSLPSDSRSDFFRVVAKTTSLSGVLSAIADANRSRVSRLPLHKLWAAAGSSSRRRRAPLHWRVLHKSRRLLASSTALIPQAMLVAFVAVSSLALVRWRMAAG
jgi:CheY-like chemotaxis protein